MTVEITLPSLSAGMEDAVIARWLIQTGETVTKGQPLAEIETDKATMELEAEHGGVIGRLDVANGMRANVGQVIALLLQEGEAALPEPIPHRENKTKRRHEASPVARRLAAAQGLNLTGLSGSGPKGRIVKLDVETHIAMRLSAPVPEPAHLPEGPGPASTPPSGIGPYAAKPLSSMRRIIARRLVESKQSVPHFYLSADCELDALLALRAQINSTRDAAEKISINDFVIKAAAHALRKVPEANVVWHGDEILQLANVDVSVAVATDGGLITPIIRGADRLSLTTLSTEMKRLAALAREARLKPEDYQGGGFSVSNLGMYGVKQFSAIINPPQSCILAVGATESRPIGRGGQVVLAEIMNVTLSVDHRSVDGALGAQLLAVFKAAIENPTLAL